MLKKIHFIGFLECLETINIEKFSSSPNHGGRRFLGVLGPYPFLILCPGPRPMTTKLDRMVTYLTYYYDISRMIL